MKTNLILVAYPALPAGTRAALDLYCGALTVYMETLKRIDRKARRRLLHNPRTKRLVELAAAGVHTLERCWQ